MRTRDWAGTVLVPCLIAAAGLLWNHTLLLVLLGGVAFVCVLVIVWDVRANPRQDGSLVGVLRRAQRMGRPLAAEAIELEPIGHLPHVDDLVRRYNVWEESVSDALASDESVPGEWRDSWLRDPEWPQPQVNPTRHDLDRLARTVGYRLRLLDWMLRELGWKR